VLATEAVERKRDANNTVQSRSPRVTTTALTDNATSLTSVTATTVAVISTTYSVNETLSNDTISFNSSANVVSWVAEQHQTHQ